jgi:hypothetical protein
VLNGAGYKVLALENRDGGINDDGVYTLSGIIELKIFDAYNPVEALRVCPMLLIVFDL